MPFFCIIEEVKWLWYINIHEQCFSSILLRRWSCMKMIVVYQYTWAMFFFHIIEEVIMYENDCGKSIYMSDVFLPYYWKGDNVWKWLWQINIHERCLSFIAINPGLLKNSKVAISLGFFKFSNHLKDQPSKDQLSEKNHQTRKLLKKYFS